MYLEPIFTSEDITKQLPLESKKFNTMERTWRRVMKQAFHTPNVRVFLNLTVINRSTSKWR